MQRQGRACRCQLLTVISMHTLPSSCCNTLHTPVARAWSSLSARREQLVHFTSAFSKSSVLLKAMCTAEMLQHASFHWRSWTHLVQRVCVQDPAASLGAQTLRGLHGSTPNVLGHLAGPHFLAHFHQFTALNRHTILGFRIIWCWPANLGLLAALYKSIWCSHSIHLWEVLAQYWLDRYLLPSSIGHEHWPAIKSFGKFTSTSPNQTLQFFDVLLEIYTSLENMLELFSGWWWWSDHMGDQSDLCFYWVRFRMLTCSWLSSL